MLCKNCGATLPDTAKFCKVCGKNPRTAAVGAVAQPVAAVKKEGFFDSINFGEIIKNPFKASYKTLNGSYRNFGILIYIVKAVIFGLAGYIFAEKVALFSDGTLLGALSNSEAKGFKSTSVMFYVLLAAIVIMLLDWLINFLAGKMAGAHDYDLAKAFGLTGVVSLFSVIPALFCFIYIDQVFSALQILAHAWDIENLDLSSYKTISIILIALIVLEVVFRTVIMFTTFIVNNPQSTPLRVLFSVIFAELLHIISVVVIIPLVIPEDLLKDIISIIFSTAISILVSGLFS
ncbi:MAG: zinc ribbon domain-containing protein [Clostridia bacterium]|nr:zinc ribbon domain-containing protein [Clostridia bacterium]